MPINLPPETPWYVVIVVLALYGVWKLIQPYLAARLKNAAEESKAVSESRIERIELDQRRQQAQFEGEKALLQHLGNLVNKVSDLAEAFVESNKNNSTERAAWLTAITRTNEGLAALQTSVDALPERIAERLTKIEKDNESDRSETRNRSATEPASQP